MRRQEDIEKVKVAEDDYESQVSWICRRITEETSPYRWCYTSSARLDENTLEKSFLLTEHNMKHLYQSVGYSWNKSEKKRKKVEFLCPSSRFLLVFEQDVLIAFAMFQFTFEEAANEIYDIPVLYW
jgi:hypothetical protein